MADAKRPKKRQKREQSPASKMVKKSLLLKIPLELRWQIYQYALSDITITVTEQERDIFNLDATLNNENKIAGLPAKYMPLVKNEYDTSLLRIGKMPSSLSKSLGEDKAMDLAGRSMDSGYASAGSSMYSNPSVTTPTTNLPLPETKGEHESTGVTPVTNVSLLHINKQIRDEVLAYMQFPSSHQPTLYVNFPYGILVLRKHYPELLSYTKNIVISGSYNPAESSQSPQSVRNEGLTTTVTSKVTQLAATDALEALTRTIYPNPQTTTVPADLERTLKSLHIRIFYPDETRYNRVWGDEYSPILAAIKNTPVGTIDLRIWRARSGNGVTMKVSPCGLASNAVPSPPLGGTLTASSHSMSSPAPRATSSSSSQPRVSTATDEELARQASPPPSPPKWRRIMRTSWRKFRSNPRNSQGHREERFWERFGDEESFSKEVPELTCWINA